MANTLNRIKEYIDFKGISVSAFEKSVGLSNGSFASQLKNNKSIGVDKLENILNVYSDLNTDWLLRGIGEMMRNVQDRIKSAPDTPKFREVPETHYNTLVELAETSKKRANELEGYVKTQQLAIEMLIKENDKLTAENAFALKRPNYFDRDFKPVHVPKSEQKK